MDRLAVDRGHKIVGQDSKLLGPRPRFHVPNADSRLARENFRSGEIDRLDAEKPVLDLPAALERVDHAAKRAVDRICIAGRRLVAGNGRQGSRQADHLPLQVDQSAAAGPQVQFRIRLDQRAEVVQGRFSHRVFFIRQGCGLAIQVRHNPPTGAGLAVASDRIRVSQRDDKLPATERRPVAQRDRRQVVRVNRQQGQVASRIGCLDPCSISLVLAGGHEILRVGLEHVVCREDQAEAVNHHARGVLDGNEIGILGPGHPLRHNRHPQRPGTDFKIEALARCAFANLRNGHHGPGSLGNHVDQGLLQGGDRARRRRRLRRRETCPHQNQTQYRRNPRTAAHKHPTIDILSPFQRWPSAQRRAAPPIPPTPSPPGLSA